jgi:hypothetical protein
MNIQMGILRPIGNLVMQFQVQYQRSLVLLSLLQPEKSIKFDKIQAQQFGNEITMNILFAMRLLKLEFRITSLIIQEIGRTIDFIQYEFALGLRTRRAMPLQSLEFGSNMLTMLFCLKPKSVGAWLAVPKTQRQSSNLPNQILPTDRPNSIDRPLKNHNLFLNFRQQLIPP